VRDVQNALAVVQKIDKNFEAFCLRTIAKYHRQIGQRADAERELRQAEAIARERGLDDDLAAITAELGFLYLDFNEYEGAKWALREAAEKETGSDRIEAQIALARADVLLGNFSSAEKTLQEAASAVNAPRNRRLTAVLHLTRGILAYESKRSAAARTEFARAAALGATDLVDEASVEARAYVGWLDARAGRLSDGEAAIRASLDQAQRMRRAGLEARCRILLARVLLLEQKPKEALTIVAPVRLEDLGLEVQAELHQVRAESYRTVGDLESARRETMLRDRDVERLRQSLSSPDGITRRASMEALLADRPVR
jgi:tetratricopeptide (TPR) repeat protein